VILAALIMIIFLLIGRFFSQKRKEFAIKLFGNYEVLMIMKLGVIAKLHINR